MKTFIYLFFFFYTLSTTQAQNVVFADPNFKAALVNDVFVNTNGDSEIQLAEAAACTDIYVPSANISNTGGLENFVNLIYFDMSYNNITTLDLSLAPNLQEIRCFGNNITSLTLPVSNTALRVLDISENAITSVALPTNLDNLDTLNVSGNQLTSLTLPIAISDLVSINASDNQLTSLDVSNGTALREVYCDDNLLTSSIVLPPLASLTNGRLSKVSCRNNRFTSLRMTEPIISLDCGGNTLMDSLWVASTALLTEEVICDHSQLVYIQTNKEIEILDCSYNQFKKINIAPQSDLRTLNCSHNPMDTLVIENSAIVDVNCSNSQLEVVDISGGSVNLNTFDSRNNPFLFCIETSYYLAARNNWLVDAQTAINDRFLCRGIWSSTTSLPALLAVNLYPNPTTSNVQLDLGQSYEEVRVVIYNSLGQMVQQYESSQTPQLEVKLPTDKGIYLLKLQTEKGIRTFRIIKA